MACLLSDTVAGKPVEQAVKHQSVAQVVAAWLAETAGSNDTSADVNATADGASSAPSSEDGDSKPDSKDKGAGGKGSGKPPVHDSPSEFWDKMVRLRPELSLCMTPSSNAVMPHARSCLWVVNWQSCALNVDAVFTAAQNPSIQLELMLAPRNMLWLQQ